MRENHKIAVFPSVCVVLKLHFSVHDDVRAQYQMGSGTPHRIPRFLMTSLRPPLYFILFVLLHSQRIKCTKNLSENMFDVNFHIITCVHAAFEGKAFNTVSWVLLNTWQLSIWNGCNGPKIHWSWRRQWQNKSNTKFDFRSSKNKMINY